MSNSIFNIFMKKKDRSKKSGTINILNGIMYVIFIIIIVSHIFSIIVQLLLIIQIINIDDELVDKTVESFDKGSDKDIMIELFSRDILRCSVKKSCCIVETIISIALLIVNIIILGYVSYIYGIRHGILIYSILVIGKMIFSTILKKYLDREDIMCPMPSKYNMLENDF